MRDSRSQIYLDYLQKAAWALFLLTLPVTSFPFMPQGFGGGTLVRPLSVYPLLVLLLLVTFPRLLKGSLPKTVLTLLPFVLVAVASSLLSLLRGIEPALGVTVAARVLRTLLTLGIGGAIYVTVALFPRQPEDLRFSLRWIYAGFAIALLWGSLQAIYVVTLSDRWFTIMNQLQKLVSTRTLFINRVSGLTYEPNWFAEQIAFLLVPWLLASVLTGSSSFGWRWRWLTLEGLLFGWAVVVTAFTFSRAGLLNIIVQAFVGILFLRSQSARKALVLRPRRRSWGRRLAEAGLAVALISTLVYAAGTKNEFFARIWDYWQTNQAHSVTGYLRYLGFGARFTYGETAYRVYEAYPVLGVGLGNYAFYFDEYLPAQPLAALPEVLRLVTPEMDRDRLITPKNFFVRLLAETGLLGAAAFMAFVAAIAGCALYLWLSPDPEERIWGVASVLGLLAFGLAAISFDSFAIPNMWVVFGLITAAARIFHRQALAERGQAAG